MKLSSDRCSTNEHAYLTTQSIYNMKNLGIYDWSQDEMKVNECIDELIKRVPNIAWILCNGFV